MAASLGFRRQVARQQIGAVGFHHQALNGDIGDEFAQMMAAARDLQFELAGRIRDEIADLKKELRGMDAAGLK